MEPLRYPETLITDSTILHRVTPQKIYGLIYTAAEAWNHAKKYDDVTHTKTNKKLTLRAVYGSCVAALNLLVTLTAEILLDVTM